MYTLRRRNALFCVPFSFVCGGRGLRSDWPGSPVAGAEADHPVGWAGKSGSRVVLRHQFLHFQHISMVVF